MIRKIIFFTFVAISLLVLPRAALAGPAQEMKENEIIKEKYVGTRYAGSEVNIYKLPDETSEVLDTTLINTSFEVIEERDGWSMITAELGNAFIKSEFLAVSEVPVFSYTDEDLYIMAHVLAGECQNCPDEEQLYVGSVVLNRVAHSQFPNTVKGVVFQKGQYACTKDGNYYREPTTENWLNARTLFEKGSLLPLNVVWQSGGRQGKGTYLKTRWHYYCY